MYTQAVEYCSSWRLLVGNHLTIVIMVRMLQLQRTSCLKHASSNTFTALVGFSLQKWRLRVIVTVPQSCYGLHC